MSYFTSYNRNSMQARVSTSTAKIHRRSKDELPRDRAEKRQKRTAARRSHVDGADELINELSTASLEASKRYSDILGSIIEGLKKLQISTESAMKAPSSARISRRRGRSGRQGDGTSGK
jgi:hypothetical protein